MDAKAQKAVATFRRLHAKYVEAGAYDVRVSDLPQKHQDEYWRRYGELHPSSFPFCALRHAYERLVMDADPVIDVDFGRDYFLPAGTVFHAGIQKWVSMSGKLLGDYICECCGHIERVTTLPDACPKCQTLHPMRYEELGGKSGKNIHWHTDGVYMRSDSSIWVLDWKTTSTAAIQNHRRTGKVFPYTSNRIQIESYIPLIEEKYKIQIDGWMLIYAARDNPKYLNNIEVVASSVDEDRKTELHERVFRDDKLFGIAKQVKEQPVKVFRKLLSNKLCQDREFYDTYVKPPYDDAGCPLAEVCFGRGLKQALKSVIEDNK